jgi:dTDP-4-amino-4,6-dideoxygalactose transaminase
VLLPDLQRRVRFIHTLKAAGVDAVFHYVPLHSSLAGKKYGRAHGDLPHTQQADDCVVRLPLWVGMAQTQITRVIETVHSALEDTAD